MSDKLPYADLLPGAGYQGESGSYSEQYDVSPEGLAELGGLPLLAVPQVLKKTDLQRYKSRFAIYAFRISAGKIVQILPENFKRNYLQINIDPNNGGLDGHVLFDNGPKQARDRTGAEIARSFKVNNGERIQYEVAPINAISIIACVGATEITGTVIEGVIV